MALFKVGITHGGFDVAVTKDFTDLINAHSVLDQAGSMGMAQGMNTTVLKSCPSNRLPD